MKKWLGLFEPFRFVEGGGESRELVGGNSFYPFKKE
jgi:hypothetical protein